MQLCITPPIANHRTSGSGNVPQTTVRAYMPNKAHVHEKHAHEIGAHETHTLEVHAQ
jgi:hypothetical protein